ncbi:MAG: metallophosphatase family protein [Bacteroidales bacterium]|nr:metallophosphatase family protein [Bacteroidales bacterium]
MKRIGILSDTHGTVPQQVYSFFKDCDEIWHAGDMGRGVYETLCQFKPVRGVYGNMDDYDLRYQVPGTALFSCEGLKVMMTHIGGWPGHYPKEILKVLLSDKPDIFVCGHSHILKVMYDKELNLLHINPGAAGRQGFHKVATLVRFVIEDGQPKDLEILDFPKV